MDPQIQTEPAVSSKELLESVKRYNQFTHWNDGSWTVIGDFDCNVIGRFTRSLTDEEVFLWCDGFETGKLRGLGEGQTMKAYEIRRTLGL